MYPDSFIAELRDRVDLLEVVSRHVTLRKSGVNWMGPCPFHQDKDPSFSVRPDKGFYKCFGCGKSGDVFSFVMAVRGGGFNEAVEELAAQVGMALPAVATDPAAERERAQRESLGELLTRVQKFYAETLRGPLGRQALAYLLERGLRQETLDRFGVGYAPPGWGVLLAQFGGGEAAVGLLEKAGLVVRKEGGGGYDRFRDRITFPIRDHRGRLLGFGGRVVGKGREQEPKYINSPETPLYHKGEVLYGLDQAQEAIQRAELALVVEGYLDLIALANHGIGFAVATLGTALTQQHLALLWRRSKRVVFCFDGDGAGRKAAWRAVEMVMDGLQADRHAGFLTLPNGEDPDETVRREGPAAFRNRLDQAVPLLDVLVEGLSRDLRLDAPEGRAAVLHRARPYLAKVGDPVLRDLYAEALEQRLGLAAGQVQRALSGVAPPLRGGARRAERTERQGAAARVLAAQLAGGLDYERMLLQELLRLPALVRRHDEVLGRLELENGFLAELLNELLQVVHARPEEWPVWPWEQFSAPEVVELARGLLELASHQPGLADLAPQGAGESPLFVDCLLLCQRREVERAIAALMQRQQTEGWPAAAYRELDALQRDLQELNRSRRALATAANES